MNIDTKTNSHESRTGDESPTKHTLATLPASVARAIKSLASDCEAKEHSTNGGAAE